VAEQYTSRSEPLLQSLDTGLQVLSLLATRESLTVASVATALGLSRSTAHRILSTLRDRGFLTLGPNRHGYFPGPAAIEMARPTRLDDATRARLRPVLMEASYRTGETVHLATLIGSQVLLFDGRESERPLRASSRVGYFRPAYAMTAGKLFLSRMVTDQVRALFPEEALTTYTPRTTATVTELIDELRTIAQREYHIASEEIEEGLNGVSVLVEGTTWRNRIALSCSVPTHRSDTASLLEIKDRLLEAVRIGKRQAAAIV